MTTSPPIQDSGEMRTMSFTRTMAFLVVMLCIHLIAPSLRLFVLRHQRRSWPFLVSDVLYGLFLLETIASWSAIAYQVVDQHAQSQVLTATEARLYFYSPKYMKLYYLLAASFNLELWTLKGVFLALYFALFKGLSAPWKLALRFTAGFCLVTGVINFSLYLGYCHPNYNDWVTYPAHCPDGASSSVPIITFQFVTNALTQIMIMCLPMGLIVNVMKKGMSATERLGFGAVIGCGFLSLTMTIARYATMRSLVDDMDNRPAYISYQELLGMAELIVANLAFCIPSYRNFFPSQKAIFSRDLEGERSESRTEMLKITVISEVDVRSQTRQEVEQKQKTEAGYALGLYALGYISSPPWHGGSSPETTTRRRNKTETYNIPEPGE